MQVYSVLSGSSDQINVIKITLFFFFLFSFFAISRFLQFEMSPFSTTGSKQ